MLEVDQRRLWAAVAWESVMPFNYLALHPDAQWFRALGGCVGCGKPATGTLMGRRNDERGPYCAKCAERAIKAAQKTREKEKTA